MKYLTHMPLLRARNLSGKYVVLRTGDPSSRRRVRNKQSIRRFDRGRLVSKTLKAPLCRIGPQEESSRASEPQSRRDCQGLDEGRGSGRSGRYGADEAARGWLRVHFWSMPRDQTQFIGSHWTLIVEEEDQSHCISARRNKSKKTNHYWRSRGSSLDLTQ
jgi:hypothetical protein